MAGPREILIVLSSDDEDDINPPPYTPAPPPPAVLVPYAPPDLPVPPTREADDDVARLVASLDRLHVASPDSRQRYSVGEGPNARITTHW